MSKNKNKDNRYRLENISIKEIVDKYPDKYVETLQKGKNTVLVLDTCKIVFKNENDQDIWLPHAKKLTRQGLVSMNNTPRYQELCCTLQYVNN